jgi:hypothetical protein
MVSEQARTSSKVHESPDLPAGAFVRLAPDRLAADPFPQKSADSGFEVIPLPRSGWPVYSAAFAEAAFFLAAFFCAAQRRF